MLMSNFKSMGEIKYTIGNDHMSQFTVEETSKVC